MDAQPDSFTADKTANLDSPESFAPSFVGKKFIAGEIVGGRYEIKALLGEGGNGVVYKVRQIFLERDMALKTLNVAKDSGTVVKRFQQEAKTSSAIEHPNLIKVLDFGVLEDETPFLVMELASGNSLAELFRQKGSINQNELISIFSKVLEGLAYAHDNGVIHRDIKPSNIMFVGHENEIDTVKIIDFGIAKITSEGGEIQSLTRTGEIFGSPLYMSPEQCLGLKVDSRSDIYSLGCVMFEALTGAPPFVGETGLLTLMKHTTEVAPSLKDGSFGGDFAPELERIIAKMLKKAPQERYQNAREAAAELLALQHSDPVQVESKQLPNGKKQALPKAWRFLVAINLTLLVCALFMILRNQKAEQVPKNVASQTALMTPKDNGNDNDNDRFFIPLSIVHRNIDGTLVRQCHFPQGIGKLHTIDYAGNSSQSQVAYIRELRTDFELPARIQYSLEVDSAYPILNRRMLSGFDDQAIVKLEINDTNLDEQLLFNISEMKGLKELSFKHTNFRDKDVVYLNKLPPLNILHLENSKITVDGILKFKNLNKLNEITLSNLKNIKKLFATLKQNDKLLTIALISCEIDKTNISEFLAFPKLYKLVLVGNANITEADIQKLLPLQSLRIIDLRDTFFPPKSYSTFRKFHYLKDLYIDTSGWKASDYFKFRSMFDKGFSLKSFKRGLPHASTKSENEDDDDATKLLESISRPEKK